MLYQCNMTGWEEQEVFALNSILFLLEEVLVRPTGARLEEPDYRKLVETHYSTGGKRSLMRERCSKFWDMDTK